MQPLIVLRHSQTAPQNNGILPSRPIFLCSSISTQMDKKRSNDPNLGPASSSASPIGVKKLRQTTLPWAPKPRESLTQPPGRNRDVDAAGTNETISPHFASPGRRLLGEPSTASPPEGREELEPGFSTEHTRFSEHESSPSAVPRQLFYPKVASRQVSQFQTFFDNGWASSDSTLYVEQRGQPSPYALDANNGPAVTSGPPAYECKIRVVDADTVDTAERMLEDSRQNVCILNMANAYRQGGGWLEGSMAQEEAICLRTTLAPTLKIFYYPIPDVYPIPGASKAYLQRLERWGSNVQSNQTALIFSPRVAITRRGGKNYEEYDFDGNHANKDASVPKTISVISVAALDLRQIDPKNNNNYPLDSQREIMRDKIRLMLRVSARRGIRRLVLGAFGCGVFRNPPAQVARLFLEVFAEEEFQGGWWEDVVFAIKGGGQGDINLQAFRSILEGKKLG
ncbi:hypothetical protein FN846DRAFT_627364 [Sphaerosporella brunnea]|uniref:Microbial-type PARG catalytic domain-containing protein n=1 Tax=Sphaerosporella brunnea TaxID=1250544 RepID=A0A5J5F0T9_9PEZI|nr:hypothetical protein FN846DRAFT_627364 [Sphaerosporella brunnea]